MTIATTRTQVLEHAQRLVQERGYNGFSYRDLAELVGIKTSSIHYYFPSKDDLLLAVVQQYSERWQAAVQAIDTGLSAEAKLHTYVDMHRQACCNTKRICLAAVLAADLASLPVGVRQAVQDFYRANEDWLVQVLEQANVEGSLHMRGDARTAARAAYAALQGSLVTARLFNNGDRLNDLLQAVLSPVDAASRKLDSRRVGYDSRL